MEYFSELQETINSEEFESKYVYNAGTDEYVEKSKPTKKIGTGEYDEWEEFDRTMGRT
jgi:hypothetical protein